MDMEYCAYSFLSEASSMCDYEIASDELASMLSLARHHILNIAQDDLRDLIELIYHANGSIRGKCAIQKEEVERLHKMYDTYFVDMKQFVIPDGCIGASHLHVLRSKSKAIIRIMTRIQQEGHVIEQSLLNFMNLLANTFFMMCLYENAHEGVEERVFVSRSYAC